MWWQWNVTAAANGTADPEMNWAEGMPPSAVNDSVRAMMSILAKWRKDNNGTLATAGTSTAYTAASNQVFASLANLNGNTICIIPHVDNGVNPTLAIDGLAAKPLRSAPGVSVPTGGMKANVPYLMTYYDAAGEYVLFGTLAAVSLASLDINGATAANDPQVNDKLPMYDQSAGANRAMTFEDFMKIINVLTTLGTPVPAADYVVVYSASAAAARKVLIQNMPNALPRGYIDGCLTSNGTDTVNDINFAAGVCRDSTNAVDITCAAMAGKQLDANWVPGANAGMRNSAAGIANGTYHLYSVRKADGTQDYYAHTSTSIATVIAALQAEPNGAAYLYARHIMSIVRVGGSILQYVQRTAGYVEYTGGPWPDIVNATPGTAMNTVALASVPLGIVCEVYCTVFTASIWIWLQSTTAGNWTPNPGANSGNMYSSYDGANGNGGDFRVWCDTSAQIKYICAANVLAVIGVIGYRHPRGTDT